LGHRPASAGGITLGRPIAKPSHLVVPADEEEAARLSSAWGLRTISPTPDRGGELRPRGSIRAVEVSLRIRAARRRRHARAVSLPKAASLAQHSLRRDALPAIADSILKAITLHQFVVSSIAAPRLIVITDQ
jgi:hypothetical protein